MKIPNLTHLQCFIIHLIAQDHHSGRYIRSRLEDIGDVKSAPAFYQAMSRLEDAKFVSGWYDTQNIDGQTIKERHYQATISGRRELRKALEFYSQIGERAAQDLDMTITTFNPAELS